METDREIMERVWREQYVARKNDIATRSTMETVDLALVTAGRKAERRVWTEFILACPCPDCLRIIKDRIA